MYCVHTNTPSRLVYVYIYLTTMSAHPNKQFKIESMQAYYIFNCNIYSTVFCTTTLYYYFIIGIPYATRIFELLPI